MRNKGGERFYGKIRRRKRSVQCMLFHTGKEINTSLFLSLGSRKFVLIEFLMKLLMISGDRSILQGKKGAFWYTLEEFAKHWERIDVICPKPQAMQKQMTENGPSQNVFFHPSPRGLWYQPWWIGKKGKELIGVHKH